MPRTARPCATPGCPHPAQDGARCPHCEARTSAGHRITLVCGPPCAGKNTWVTQHAKHGDLVVDMDALYTALNAAPRSEDHDQPAALRPFAFDARDAVVERLFSGDHSARAAWIISSAPKRQQRAQLRSRGVRVVMISADQATCEARARQHRPDTWIGHIAEWFAAFEDGAVDEVVEATGPAPRQGAGGRGQAATGEGPMGEPYSGTSWG